MPHVLARIDLAALRSNYNTAKDLAPNSFNFAVIKADAYGHGSVQCARALHQADGFAVATIEEAVQLRQHDIDKPVLVLSRFCQPDEVKDVQNFNLMPVIHSHYQLDILISKHNSRQPINAWLKVDTGMNRLGMNAGEFLSMLNRIENSGCVNAVGLMTHLACADETDNEFTAVQLKNFHKLAIKTNLPLSIANSAGIIAWPDTRKHWNRPGLMLYGVSPLSPNKTTGSNSPIDKAMDKKLQPVMRLVSRLISIRTLKRGEGIGYGQTFVADEDINVGIVACGYADGYPRHAGTGTPILICDKPSRLLGRVSMDTLAVDLTPVSDATVGSPVLLWGSSRLSVKEIAGHAGTIAYELLTSVSNRVPRQYID